MIFKVEFSYKRKSNYMPMTINLTLFYSDLGIIYNTHTFHYVLSPSKYLNHHFIWIHSLKAWFITFYRSIEDSKFVFWIRFQLLSLLIYIEMLSLLKFDLISDWRGTYICDLDFFVFLKVIIIIAKADIDHFRWDFYID